MPGERLLIHGGQVRTCDKSNPVAEAVLIEKGRILAVGATADLRAMASPGAREMDVDGAVVLPGLIDTHPHLLHYGSLEEPLVDLRDARDHAEIRQRIAARARVTPAGEWIMTTPVGDAHFFITRSARDLPEGDLPDRHFLDAITSDHPVVIQSWAPVLPNVIAFNSQALQRLGLDESLPDRIGNVWIERDSDGRLTGRLRGSVTHYYNNDAFANDLWLKIPFLQYEQLIPGTKTAIAAYHRLGVTGVYENHMMDKVLIDAYRTLRRDGDLRLRVVCSQEAEAYGMPWSRPRAMDDFMARLEDAAGSIVLDDDLFRFNGVTIMWDGNCYPGGMMMKADYRGPYGEMTCGYRHITPEKAEITMRFCAERGIRLNTICMGTQASEENLAMLERLSAEYDIASLRWLLVHAIMIEPEQIARYRRLNMDLTTSMAFCWGKGDMLRERFGEEALRNLMPLGSFFEAGFAVAGASDWGPKSAFQQIELALTHAFAGSGFRNQGPNQRIGREEALAMWTSDAAHILDWPEIGKIRAGAYADLAIVDRDPVTCPIDDIGRTEVLRTLFNGEIVHDAC